MANLAKIRVNDMLALKKKCTDNGIDYDSFIEGCKIIYKSKHLTNDLLIKANAALNHIITYGTEKAKLTNTTIQELAKTTSLFDYGFRYAISQDENVDASIRKFAAYCIIHFDITNPDSMQKLAAKVNKQMKLGLKPDSPGYLDAILQAIPNYSECVPNELKGELTSLFNKIMLKPKRPSFATANALCLPDARQYYSADDDSFALEFFARQEDEPQIEGRCEKLILVYQLGHYLICSEDGQVLHDSLEPRTFSDVQRGDISEWVEERQREFKPSEFLNLPTAASSTDGIYTVTDSEGLIVLATPNSQEANAFQCFYNSGGVTDEYIKQHLFNDYGMNEANYEKVTKAILQEASSKYDLSKFAHNCYQALFAITPLLAANVDKF